MTTNNNRNNTITGKLCAVEKTTSEKKLNSIAVYRILILNILFFNELILHTNNIDYIYTVEKRHHIRIGILIKSKTINQTII